MTLWLRYTGGCTDLGTIRTLRRINPKTRKVVNRHSGDTRRSRRAMVLPIPTAASLRRSSCYSQGHWSHEAPSHYREHETSKKPAHIYSVTLAHLGSIWQMNVLSPHSPFTVDLISLARRRGPGKWMLIGTYRHVSPPGRDFWRSIH